MAEGHHLYDKSHNYHSSIINDDKNPYLLITREELIAKYQLKHHPLLTGHYQEIHRSELYVSIEDSVKGNKKLSRPASTSCYYVLTGNEICYLHRMPFDATLHFYLGKPFVVVLLNRETQSYSEIILGNNLEKNENLTVSIPANTWFGTYLITNTEHLSKVDRDDKVRAEQTSDILIRKKDSGDEVIIGNTNLPQMSEIVELVNPESFNYGLIGITVSPGIEQEEEDIEIGNRDHLVAEFPAAMDRIQLLTKNENDLSKLVH